MLERRELACKFSRYFQVSSTLELGRVRVRFLEDCGEFERTRARVPLAFRNTFDRPHIPRPSHPVSKSRRNSRLARETRCLSKLSENVRVLVVFQNSGALGRFQERSGTVPQVALKTLWVSIPSDAGASRPARTSGRVVRRSGHPAAAATCTHASKNKATKERTEKILFIKKILLLRRGTGPKR